MTEATEFALWARHMIDFTCAFWAVLTVMQAAAYNAGLTHSLGGSSHRAALLIVNAIGFGCWLVWRPAF